MRRLRARAALTAALAATFTIVTTTAATAEYRGSDPFDNVMPDPFITSPDADRYPVGAYALDYDVNLGVPGVTGDSWFPAAAQWFVAQAWDILAHIVMLLIDALTWAFSVNFITGPNGLLPAIGQAMGHMNTNVIDQRYVVIAVGMLGVWGGFKALSQPTQVISTFATSLGCTMLVMALIAQPTGIYATAVNMVNDLSAGVMATLDPESDSADDGQRAARDHLHQMGIERPWYVLQFGGLQHCVDTGDVDDDGFPTNVKKNARTKGAKVCRDHTKARNGWGGYGPGMLAEAPGSNVRHWWYLALRDGKIPDERTLRLEPGANGLVDVTSQSAEQALAGVNVDKADSPAADLMQSGGAGKRLLMAFVIFAGLIAIIALLARMIGVILVAGLASLALLAFAPIALLFGIVPAGHPVFKWWLKTLCTMTFMKLIVALILVTLLVVSMAISAMLLWIDFMFVWIAQSGFYWLVYKKRSKILEAIGGTTANQMNRRGLSFATAYAASRPYRAMGKSFRRSNQRKVGFGRGQNDNPENQDTAVRRSHNFTLADTGGNGSVTPNLKSPAATGVAGAVVGAATVAGAAKGAAKGNGVPGTNGAAPPTGPHGTTPATSAAPPTNGSAAGADPSSTTTPWEPAAAPAPTATPAAPPTDPGTKSGPAWFDDPKWDAPATQPTEGSPHSDTEPGALHEDVLRRLGRHPRETDAFGRDVPRTPPPPPPPEGSSS